MANDKLFLEKTFDRCVSENPKLTVVLIHGIASDSTTFSGLLDYLANIESLKDVRFVTFDLLGSGKSLKDDKLNYDYSEQLAALKNSINRLNVKTPMVLAGHSLGTFIVTRYASKYKAAVSRLLLISAPVYTAQDLDNPDFDVAMKAFEKVVAAKNEAIVREKSFKNSMKNIVLDKTNYETLASISIPTTIVYGVEDQLIGLPNYPKLLKDNNNIVAIETDGRHSVTKEKYSIIEKILEEELNA